MSQILHRITGSVLAENAVMSHRELVTAHKLNLRFADLSGLDLNRLDLSDGDFSGASFSDADLSFAIFRRAKLAGCRLGYSVCIGADFRGADLSGAGCISANFSGCDFSSSDLRHAGMIDTNLYDAVLGGADLRYANLSRAKGVPRAAEWLESNFKTDALGVIVYRRVGGTYCLAPSDWKIEPGAFITENPDSSRSVGGGYSGVYFGTLELCTRILTHADLWKCRIRWIDLVDTVIPYDLTGEGRCARLELLEIVQRGDP